MIDKRTKIILIDTDGNYRLAMKLLFQEHSMFQLTATFGRLEDIELDINFSSTDILVFDCTSITPQERAFISNVISNYPYLSVLFQSNIEDDLLVTQSFAVGISGFIKKERLNGHKYLEKAIKDLHEGRVPLSRRASRILVEKFHKNYNSPLTVREDQVLKEMSLGMSYTQIGSSLEISPETVKTHMRNIYEKLHVSNKSEAIEVARGKSWV